MSIHIDRARQVARERGAWAGSCPYSLWQLSKRELLEIALRQCALSEGTCDDQGAGEERLLEELAALRQQGIV